MEDSMVTIIVAIIASSGFWTLVAGLCQKYGAKGKCIRGLAHDKILYLGTKYLKKGYVTSGELDNLLSIYEPYRAMNGNGTAKAIMDQVYKLDVRKGDMEI